MSDNTRKPRKTMTLEVFEMVKRFLEDETLSMKEIASRTDLSTETIRNFKKQILMDIPFTPRSEKVKITSELRIRHFSEIETRTYHELSMDNLLTLKDLKNKLEAYNILSSKSTISNKIKKIGFTRKRLTRIPNERNTQENIK